MLHSTSRAFHPISLNLLIEQMPSAIGDTDQDDSRQGFLDKWQCVNNTIAF